MDCDGLKKDLLIDTDGTLFGQAASVFSQADYLWGKLVILLRFLKDFSSIEQVINNMAWAIIVFH